MALVGGFTIASLTFYHERGFTLSLPVAGVLGILGLALLGTGIQTSCLAKKDRAKENEDALSTVSITAKSILSFK